MTSRRAFLARLGAAAAGPADLEFGYAAIAWGGNDRQAIDDIVAVGFRGIQLRSNVLREFGERPADLRALLLSSGDVRIDPAAERQAIEEHAQHARFVHDVGGRYLQVTDQRPKDRAIVPDDMRRLGRLLTEIGRRTT